MNTDPKDFEVLIKIVLLGESGVGKTSLLTRYMENKFDNNLKATIGIDCRYKIEQKYDKKIKINFYDTAGQERFNSVVTSSYKGSDGIILVYDISRYETFEKIETWLDKIKQNCSPDIKIFLLGNKLDLDESNRNVAFEEAKNFAEINQLYFFECSALNNINNTVNLAFDKLIENILSSKMIEEDELEKMEFMRAKTKTLIIKKPSNEKKKCC